MTVITEGPNTFIEHDGKRSLINPVSASMKMGDDEIFRFDGKTGLLELSMSATDIDVLVASYGGLPIAEMCVPAPLEQPRVQNVRMIRPLPRKDGMFLISLSQPVPQLPGRGWFGRLFR